MQTIYYSTPNFIRHTGNVVDLAEYRRKLSLAQEGSLAPQPDCHHAPEAVEESRARPALGEVPSRRSQRRQRRAWALDICASLGILVMTLTFTVHVLML